MARTVKYDFNPEKLTGEEIPKGKKDEVRAEIADFILNAILKQVDSMQSPVAGKGKFKPLTKEYKSFKKSKGKGGRANLDFTGALLNALEVKPSGVNIRTITKGRQGDKADGHNNHSGESKLPLRRYIPKGKEKFDSEIMSGVAKIIKESQ